MFINHYELKVEWDSSAGVLYTLKVGPSTWVPPFLWLWMTADDFYRFLTSHTLHTFVGWGATHPLHEGWCPEMSQTLQIKNIQAEGRVSADPDTATYVYQVLSDRWEGFLFSLYILFCKIPLDLPVHAEKNQLICPFQTCVGVVWDDGINSGQLTKARAEKNTNTPNCNFLRNTPNRRNFESTRSFKPSPFTRYKKLVKRMCFPRFCALCFMFLNW